MRVYGEKDDCPLAGRRPVVALGVFDGVHLGHRAIFTELAAEGFRLGSPTMAITFDPHPRLALGRSAPPGICSLENRIRLMADSGMDAVWVLPFTRELSAIAARAFAEEFFHRRLDAAGVVIGASAVFGHDRDGNAATLAKWAAGWNMTVKAVPPVVDGNHTVSSTAIRLAVSSGDLARAVRFLGRAFSVQGTVVHGQGRGHNFGFPTLNLDPHHELRPPPGVYLTRAHSEGGTWNSVTNIGRPPTDDEIAAGLTDFLIETHLLDFAGDLYGKTAEVSFLRKVRNAMRFESSRDLVEQVHMDLAAAREWFGENE